MNKKNILNTIISVLRSDLNALTEAAKAAHAAATHTECLPDNKYDTTGLEASYIAQGQANRAQEIRSSLDSYRNLVMRDFDADEPIRLTALVSLEDDDGTSKQIFLGPEAGGVKIGIGGEELVVITPMSPLGRALLGKVCGDEVSVGIGGVRKTFTVVAVA